MIPHKLKPRTVHLVLCTDRFIVGDVALRNTYLHTKTPPPSSYYDAPSHRWSGMNIATATKQRLLCGRSGRRQKLSSQVGRSLDDDFFSLSSQVRVFLSPTHVTQILVVLYLQVYLTRTEQPSNSAKRCCTIHCWCQLRYSVWVLYRTLQAATQNSVSN